MLAHYCRRCGQRGRMAGRLAGANTPTLPSWYLRQCSFDDASIHLQQNMNMAPHTERTCCPPHLRRAGLHISRRTVECQSDAAAAVPVGSDPHGCCEPRVTSAARRRTSWHSEGFDRHLRPASRQLLLPWFRMVQIQNACCTRMYELVRYAGSSM